LRATYIGNTHLTLLSLSHFDDKMTVRTLTTLQAKEEERKRKKTMSIKKRVYSRELIMTVGDEVKRLDASALSVLLTRPGLAGGNDGDDRRGRGGGGGGGRGGGVDNGGGGRGGGGRGGDNDYQGGGGGGGGRGGRFERPADYVRGRDRDHEAFEEGFKYEMEQRQMDTNQKNVAAQLQQFQQQFQNQATVGAGPANAAAVIAKKAAAAVAEPPVAEDKKVEDEPVVPANDVDALFADPSVLQKTGATAVKSRLRFSSGGGNAEAAASSSSSQAAASAALTAPVPISPNALPAGVTIGGPQYHQPQQQPHAQQQRQQPQYQQQLPPPPQQQNYQQQQPYGQQQHLPFHDPAIMSVAAPAPRSGGQQQQRNSNLPAPRSGTFNAADLEAQLLAQAQQGGGGPRPSYAQAVANQQQQQQQQLGGGGNQRRNNNNGGGGGNGPRNNNNGNGGNNNNRR
jgi:hypothetical protein